jgi:murein DD-endopeptidase MepM/ murein hydrolase activator NlpD
VSPRREREEVRHRLARAFRITVILASFAAVWMTAADGLAEPPGKKADRHILASAAPAKKPAQPPRAAPRRTVEITLAKGNTLNSLLGQPSLRILNRDAVLGAIKDMVDFRKLQPGDKVRLSLEDTAKGARVRSLHLRTSQTDDVTIDIAEGGAASRAVAAKRVQVSVHQVSGKVGANFGAALQKATLPKALVAEVLAAARVDSDMPAKPSAKARFAVVYETVARDRVPTETRLKLVSIDDGKKVHRLYRYQTEDGGAAYLQENGRGVAVVDMRRPVESELISSPYGWRIHPVFGDRRFHKGVDYAAPLGTPVTAAADGKVADVGWRGNYVQYIRLDHTLNLATAYAHLSGFAPGVGTGTRVRKGQVIGYVGETGVATGPHLYYEVMLNGEHLDPLKVPDKVPYQLQGPSFAAFRVYAENARRQTSIH